MEAVIVASYDGPPDSRNDALLNRLSRRNLAGIGYDFGIRHYSWRFTSKSAAAPLKRKLRRYRRWLVISTV